MLLRFWENPEFVRHLRAELRPPRAITAALLTLVIIVLVGLWAWGVEHKNAPTFVKTFHLALVVIQFTLLGFWCASACGQAVSRERELKTFDFQKTTRLSPAEILVGKLLGAPVVIYFVVACCLPVSFVAGLLAGYPMSKMAWLVALLAAFGLFVGLIGLWVSMLVQKSGAGTAIVIALLPMAWLMGFSSTPLAGFGSLSIVTPLLSIYRDSPPPHDHPPTVFGFGVSHPPLTVALYLLFGAWIVLMLVRNLKKEREQMRLLTRWQGAGLAVFLNVLFYALLDPMQVESGVGGKFSPREVSGLAIGMNALLMFLLGIATLTPREKLKSWWRRRDAGVGGYFTADALSWPYLAAVAGLGYALLCAEAVGLSRVIPIQEWDLRLAALQMLVLLVFVTRDVLFLQWCLLTRLKRPVWKGVLYLLLYYSAGGIVGGVAAVASQPTSSFLLAMLTPAQVLAARSVGEASAGLYAGLVLQLGLIVLVHRGIFARLSRPPVAPAPSPATT